jgi:hypothetical protein
MKSFFSYKSLELPDDKELWTFAGVKIYVVVSNVMFTCSTALNRTEVHD